MPGRDRTGPVGMGPMTGRRTGYCAGNTAPGYSGWAPGDGFGATFGRGRRNRFFAGGPQGRQWAWARAYGGRSQWGYHPFHAPELPKGQELRALKEQAAYFENVIQDIRKRMEELESGTEKP